MYLSPKPLPLFGARVGRYRLIYIRDSILMPGYPELKQNMYFV